MRSTDPGAKRITTISERKKIKAVRKAMLMNARAVGHLMNGKPPKGKTG
jgi:hypothetical protein